MLWRQLMKVLVHECMFLHVMLCVSEYCSWHVRREVGRRPRRRLCGPFVIISLITFLNMVSYYVSVGWCWINGVLQPFVYGRRILYMCWVNIELVVGDKNVFIPSISGLRMVDIDVSWHWKTWSQVSTCCLHRGHLLVVDLFHSYLRWFVGQRLWIILINFVFLCFCMILRLYGSFVIQFFASEICWGKWWWYFWFSYMTASIFGERVGAVRCNPFRWVIKCGPCIW